MLLRFTVENYLSFKNRVEFSMIPGRLKKHPHHVIAGEKSSEMKALKAAIIYGANASGKSNIVKAMNFAKNMIVRGLPAGRSIPTTAFKLNTKSASTPSRFEFEIKIKDKSYAYGFSLDSKKVHEEWLYEISKTTDKALFERVEVSNEYKYRFSNIKYKKADHKKFLEFVAKGTLENRLFLHECKERNVLKELNYITAISDVLNWFEDTLTVIAPDSRYLGLEVDHDYDEDNKLDNLLKYFDTGVNGLVQEEVDLNSSSVDIPDDLKRSIVEKIDGEADIVLTNHRNDRYRFRKSSIDEGDVVVSKLRTAHLNEQQDEVRFDICEESDGTQRLLDLMPCIIDLVENPKVYVIDEIDRSLHSDLTVALFKYFFENSDEIASQLISTTHEDSLLDQDLIRRDEVWFTQKEKDSSTNLYSLEEYKTRFDKNIRNGYRAGRFGGVPILNEKYKNIKSVIDA